MRLEQLETAMWVCIGYTSNVKVFAVVRLQDSSVRRGLGLLCARQSQFQPVSVASLVAIADKMGAHWEKVFPKKKPKKTPKMAMRNEEKSRKKKSL